MNTFKKKTLNMAVGAALGMAVAAPATADSLLAPLVIETGSRPSADLDSSSNIRTFFQVKVQGFGNSDEPNNGVVDANWDFTHEQESRLHYTWFRKGNSLHDLRNSDDWCDHSNARGETSPWDMVMQSVARSDDADGSLNQFPNDRFGGWDDLSEVKFASAPFVGFMILDDEIRDTSGLIPSGWKPVGFDPENPATVVATKEGNFSGHAYVVSFDENIILDYKLLNNHLTARSGDFSAGFISKKTVDLAWWPVDFVDTEWLVLAVGADMVTNPDGTPVAPSDWAGTVRLTQEAADTPVSATAPFGGSGVYDHDEMVYSGEDDPTIVCMNLIDRDDFMTQEQLDGTTAGGWTRKWIQPLPDHGDPDNPTTANGAIVYRLESSPPFGELNGGHRYPHNLGLNNRVNWSAFQVETGGHANPNGPRGGAHPNRPY